MRPCNNSRDSEAIGSNKRSNSGALRMSEDALTLAQHFLAKSIAEQDENGSGESAHVLPSIFPFCPVSWRIFAYCSKADKTDRNLLSVDFYWLLLVGATGIEPVTPPV